jgi:hypothetical protein
VFAVELEQPVDVAHERTTLAHIVECAAHDERFERFFVEIFVGDPRQEVTDIGERPRARFSMMESATPVPKFFIEYNPKRMVVSSTTVKLPRLSLTDGGSTRIPMRLHSATTSAIFSTSPASAVSTAAM